MPSSRVPTAAVVPGAGKAAAGTVPASALLGVPLGGGGSSLDAHVTDPVDAHMSTAIGIPATDSVTLEPLLSSAGGPIDGESVKDFIAAIKDLQPPRPGTLGFDVGVPNTGIPNWTYGVDPDIVGGFADGAAIGYSHAIVNNLQGTLSVTGVLYPADRGCLAVYFNTSNDYFDAPNTTLLAALWLGPGPAPSGIPDAAFDETARPVTQADYIAAGSGIDLIYLTDRVAYLRDYVPFSLPYTNFDANFYRYQIATYTLDDQTVSFGESGSYLLVHWRESFVDALADLSPTNLTLATLVAANAYSAVPSGGDFDGGEARTVNRRRVYRDTQSALAPSLVSVGATVGAPPTVFLSGVEHYTSTITWSMDVRANDLFKNSFLFGFTGGAFVTPAPLTLAFNEFGGPNVNYAVLDLRPTGGALYTNGVGPQPADQGQLLASVNLASLSPLEKHTQEQKGYSNFVVVMRKPFQTVTTTSMTTNWLFNSYSQTGGAVEATQTLEPFKDEYYRYDSAYDPLSATVTIIPAPLDAYDPTNVLVSDDGHGQVIGDELRYPGVDYSAASFRPTAQPDYAAVGAGDTLVPAHIRRYVRAFNVGGPSARGRIRINGLAFEDYESIVAFTGNEETDHPGGVIVQIRVPGISGWLDLGRNKGDPDLTIGPFRGCRTHVEVIDAREHIVTYDTGPGFTSDNGSGEFLLFVRISFLATTGQGFAVNEIEWLPDVP